MMIYQEIIVKINIILNNIKEYLNDYLKIAISDLIDSISNSFKVILF